MNYWYKKGQELIDDVRSTADSSDSVSLWFIGQVGFIVKYRDSVIFIDPVLNDLTDSEGNTLRYYEAPFGPQDLIPDYVICTHGHCDHMAGETLHGIAEKSEKTKFVIPAGCKDLGRQYGITEEAMVLLTDETQVQLNNDICVSAFSTAHPQHVYEESNEEMALGYEISCNGKTVIHLGDTYLTETLLTSLKKKKNPDVLILPINGDDLFRKQRDIIGNMNAEEAALLSMELKADLTLPAHFDMFKGNTVDPLRFASAVREKDCSVRWHIPVLGERILV